MATKTSTRPATITQALLAEVSESNRLRNEHKKRYDELRGILLDLHDRSAEVEPGKFSYRVKVQAQRRLNKKTLLAILGVDEVTYLLENVPLTETRQLILKEF